MHGNNESSYTLNMAGTTGASFYETEKRRVWDSYTLGYLVMLLMHPTHKTFLNTNNGRTNIYFINRHFKGNRTQVVPYTFANQINLK